jgi:small subunit ribosomal protein S8
MSMTDPIADLLTRVRNGHTAKHRTVRVPHSRTKESIVRLLVDAGYLAAFDVEGEGASRELVVELKYDRDGTPAITGLSRISRPGRRVYCGKGDVPRVLGGLGVVILSTPRGIMTGGTSAKQGVGGEVLCSIW